MTKDTGLVRVSDWPGFIRANIGYITRLTAFPTIRFTAYWKEGTITCGLAPIKGWWGLMSAKTQFRRIGSRATWKWLSLVTVLSSRISRRGHYFLVVRTDSLRLARMINFRKNTCLLCISTASLFLVKSAIFMIFCKALRSKKLWCWTIVRTSLTFHLLPSITLTGTIILTLIR